MEKRNKNENDGVLDKGVDIPADYAKMVAGVFATNFAEGLEILGKVKPNPYFEVKGTIFSDEILVAVALMHENQISATSVYASVDFDPKASSPTAEDLLAVCIDAVGGFFANFLDPKDRDRIEKLAEHSLSAFEDVPFNWSGLKVRKRNVFLRVDKANPVLEEATDSFLKENDPNYEENLKKDQKEAEDLLSQRLDEADDDDPTPGGKKKKTIH